MTAPAPLSPGWPSIGDVLGAALRAAPVVDQFTYEAARAMARDLAPWLGVTEGDVFEALHTVPDNMLPLLRSPDGWAALASFVAADFGVALNTYTPAIH